RATPSPAKQHEPKTSDISYDQYFSRLDELSDRFVEKEKFIAEINHCTVKWSGVVNSVSSNFNGITVQLQQSNEQWGNLAHLDLPDDCKTQALALRKGDRINFEGELDTTIMVNAPNIHAKSFEISLRE
ncbi:MAG: hypothetical protein Q9M30_07815, partial [Mariprofundaceae bacterium]|nr:hypothetical protein [Mariprofundaceae bacterium]